MPVQSAATKAKHYLERWFHKRNIIIVSKKRVKHINISGKMQFIAVVIAAGGVCWLAFSTGNFLAARSALKEETKAFRALASTRMSGFGAVLPTTALAQENAQSDVGGKAKLNEPMFTIAAESRDQLVQHLASLEKQVSELQATNESIVERVRDKAGDHIDDLESALTKMGLDAADMKHELSAKTPSKSAAPSNQEESSNASAPAEGGPFIPADSSNFISEESAMFTDLDKLNALHQIIGVLPLAVPIAEYEEESGFGRRIDPFNGHMAFHSGLDMAGPYGAKIYSTADGIVTLAGKNGAYGNCIDISHQFGVSTRYGHLSEVLVQPGQFVHKGDVIGLEGSTGRSTGPHLHYEVRYHDQPLNPKNFLEAGRYVSQE